MTPSRKAAKALPLHRANKSIKDTSARPFFILTLGLFVLLFLTTLVRYGMYNDGLIYASIARNMAQGHGGLWQPFYSPTHWQVFYEHPPLGLWLESLFFRLLGDHFYVERVFCLVVAISSMAVFTRIWRISFNSTYCRALLWVPSFLFLTNTLILKHLSRNMLDPILSLFTLLASWVLINNLIEERKRWMLDVSIAAILIVSAFLINGFQAFFPFSIPILNHVTRKSTSLKQALLQTGWLMMVTAAILALLFFIQPAAWIDIKHYVLTQVLPSTVGNRIETPYTGWGRLNILAFPLQDCLLGCLLLLVFYQAKWIKHPKCNNEQTWQTFWFYLLIALSATLPVTLAHRQSDSYILQSMPFYLLALAQYLTPGFAHVIDHYRKWSDTTKQCCVAGSVILVSCACMIVVLVYGGVRRDHIVLHDTLLIGRVVPKGAIVSVTPQTLKGPGGCFLEDYLGRYFQIAIKQSTQSKYLIDAKKPASHQHYQRIPIETIEFNLYKKQASQ